MPTFGPTTILSGDEVAYYTSSEDPQKSPNINAPEYGQILMLGELKGPRASFILRWESTGIPQGATISEALLRWRILDPGSAEGRVRGHKVASPPHLYDDYANATERKTAISSAFTSESTTDSLFLTGQSTGAKIHTITDIVQEIVNVDSWNGTVQLFVINEENSMDINWGIANHTTSYEKSSLEVSYTGGGGEEATENPSALMFFGVG